MSASHDKTIAFTKASACGNDFLIAQGDGLADLSKLSQRMCDRHNGIGADGVEWTFPDSDANIRADVRASVRVDTRADARADARADLRVDVRADVGANVRADVRVRLFNADGSEAEISGNGTRCVAAEIADRMGKKEVLVRTAAGVKTCRLIEQQGSSFEFESEMGSAEVGGQLAIETMWVRAIGTVVSMGNPHFVIFVERFQEGWQKQAALIQTQPQFPQGTNVEYVMLRGPNEIEIRLFERGVGETLSSGTGSCASAVAAIASHRVASPVRVLAPGGAQTVQWENDSSRNQVYLRGPATLICRGEFFV